MAALDGSFMRSITMLIARSDTESSLDEMQQRSGSREAWNVNDSGTYSSSGGEKSESDDLTRMAVYGEIIFKRTT